MTTVSHVAHCAPLIPTGISYMTAIISSLISLAAGFGLGWYVKGRGMTGVQNDLNNVKVDISNLKAKFDAPTPAVTPAAV